MSKESYEAFKRFIGAVIMTAMAIAVIVTLFGIVGCGSDGGAAPTPAAGTPPGVTCKSIYSVWSSTTDFEVHDFTLMSGGVTLPDYGYTASNGATCGYASNPNHALTARLIVPVGAAAYDYELRMQATLQMVGSCATYYQTGSSGGGTYSGYILESACNEIQICEDAFANSLGNCKTFQ